MLQRFHLDLLSGLQLRWSTPYLLVHLRQKQPKTMIFVLESRQSSAGQLHRNSHCSVVANQERKSLRLIRIWPEGKNVLLILKVRWNVWMKWSWIVASCVCGRTSFKRTCLATLFPVSEYLPLSSMNQLNGLQFRFLYMVSLSSCLLSTFMIQFYYPFFLGRRNI